MRILLLGDTQLGSGRTIGRTLTEQDALLQQVTDIADTEQVDLIVHLGDAFESRTTNRDEDEVFVRFLVRASAISRVLLVAGNHDWRGFEKASTIGLFRELGVDVALTPRVYRYGDAAIGCLPWVSPASLIASRNGSDRSAINLEVADLLVRAAGDLVEQIGKGGSAILLGHWALTGGSLPTGLAVESLGEPVLPLSALTAQGWDALAFGHIHRLQVLSERPLAFHAGSPWVNDWGEAGQDHGVWIMETDPLEVRFVPVEDRDFITIDAELDDQEPGAYLKDLIAPWHIAGNTVRLRYTATAEQARRIDAGKIREALVAAGASRVFLAPTIIREERARVEGVDENLEPLAALDLYIEHNGIEPGLAERMRERTKEYLERIA